MNMHADIIAVVERGRLIAISLVVALALGLLLPATHVGAQESPSPAPEASAEPSLTPSDAACESVDDLRLIIDFLRETDPSEDGWVPVLVGVVAGLSEARQLLGLVGETYRPLVEDLVVSLQDLRDTVDEISDEETLGARIATISESVADIGYAMDALGAQLRTRCSTDG
jgi:hypothetical protein